MYRKLLVTGGVGLLAVSALGSTARAQEQSRAPVPTTPTSQGSTPTTLSIPGATTTTQPTTSAEQSTADTGPHDYIAWLSLAGVASIAAGISMRGRRADGSHWR